MHLLDNARWLLLLDTGEQEQLDQSSVAREHAEVDATVTDGCTGARLTPFPNFWQSFSRLSVSRE